LSAHIKKELFRNLAHDLFARLQTPRKRVIAERQLVLLEKILAHTETEVNALVRATASEYSKTTNPRRAVYRDLNSLISLGAVGWKREGGADPTSKILLFANLDWPSKITETAFFAAIKQMPKAKKHSFLVGE
jgi:hypothetical protein